MTAYLEGARILKSVLALLQQRAHLLLAILGVIAAGRGRGRNDLDALLQVAGGASALIRRHSATASGRGVALRGAAQQRLSRVAHRATELQFATHRIGASGQLSRRRVLGRHQRRGRGGEICIGCLVLVPLLLQLLLLGADSIGHVCNSREH